MSSFELWHPVSDVPEYLHGAWVLQLGSNELLVVCDGHFKNGKCPILLFGATEAFRVCEELAHGWAPSEKLGTPPKFPFFKIIDSTWAESSSGTRLFGESFTHFCVVSADCIVEVLSQREPQVRWAVPADIDSLFDRAGQLGEA